MDHESQAEAFEVLPPATPEQESWNEYEQEGASAQGEFEDELRDHRRGGAPVRTAWGGRHVPTPVSRRSTLYDHRSSRPGVQNIYRTYNTYAPRGPSGLYGGGVARYGTPGWYGSSGYYGARPWVAGSQWGPWGRWPNWYRPRWPGQGWYAGAVAPPDADDGDNDPPPPMPVRVVVAPPPFVPPDPPPPPVVAFAQPPGGPAQGPMPAPPDTPAPPNAGASSEFEFGFGSDWRGRGRGHHRGCRCGNCMAGSPFGGFAQEEEVAGGPAQAKPACASYTPGEVQRSTSATGVLRASVFDHPRGTVVGDFGVNWRTPRDSLAKDPALAARLRQWLEIARSDPTMRMRVLGFSDCVGDERDNLFLRKGRATRMAALLERIAGKAAFDALRPRIIAVEAAPIGDFLESNDSVEGRAVNRGVLFEFKREIKGDPMTIVACRPKPADFARYPLLALIPNVPDYRNPLPIEFRIDAKKMVGDLAQDLHSLGEKAHVLVEAVDWGITALDMFEVLALSSTLSAVLGVLGPVLAFASFLVGVSASDAEAAEEIAAREAASGFSDGLVMGANNASFRKMKEYFGNLVFPKNDFLPQGKAIATANYRAGLVAGFAQARALCPAQRDVVMRDLSRRMGDQSWRGDPSRWSDRDRRNWYIDAAATFNGAHLVH